MDLIHYVNKNNVYQSKELTKTDDNYNVCIDDDSFVIGVTIGGVRVVVDSEDFNPQEVFAMGTFLNSDFIKTFVGGVRCINFTTSQIKSGGMSSDRTEIIIPICYGILALSSHQTFDTNTEQFVAKSGFFVHHASSQRIYSSGSAVSEFYQSGIKLGEQIRFLLDTNIAVAGESRLEIEQNGVIQQTIDISGLSGVDSVDITYNSLDVSMITLRWVNVSGNYYIDNVRTYRPAYYQGQKIEVKYHGVISPIESYFLDKDENTFEPSSYDVGKCPLIPM